MWKPGGGQPSPRESTFTSPSLTSAFETMLLRSCLACSVGLLLGPLGCFVVWVALLLWLFGLLGCCWYLVCTALSFGRFSCCGAGALWLLYYWRCSTAVDVGPFYCLSDRSRSVVVPQVRLSGDTIVNRSKFCRNQPIRVAPQNIYEPIFHT